MKNIFIILPFVLVSTLIFLSCNNNTPAPIEIGENQIVEEEISDEIVVTKSQFDLGKMKLGTFGEYNFPATIRTTGKIEIPAKNHIKVSAYSGGYITNINLIPDERVTKGQVLFTLENPELVEMQQAYLEAREQLNFLKSDYERQKTLAAENIASQKNFLKAESEYRVTIAKMEGMKKRLSMLKINTDNINAQNLVSTISVVSPSSGYVSAVHATKGMFLNPTDVAIEILNTDHLHIELSVFEKDILKIKKGQSLTFRIPEASTKTFEAKVHLIGRTVDEKNRVVRVLAHLKNKKDIRTLVAGMTVEAEIVTEDNPMKGLPESAIIAANEHHYILIKKENTGDDFQFEQKEVSLGERKNGFVQILNNNEFTGKENILTEGGFNLIGIE